MRKDPCYTPLRRRADFRRLHAQGRRKGDALLQVRAAPHPTSASISTPLRLGILVTKKYGSAVERNRFKRLVREAVRALAPGITAGWDILVLPRETHGVKMPAVLASLRGLLGALGMLRNDDAVAGMEGTQG